MCDEFQLFLAGKDGAIDRCFLEIQAKRRKAARFALQPKVTARLDVKVNRDGRTVGCLVRQRGRSVRGFVLAILDDGFKGASNRDTQQVRGSKEVLGTAGNRPLLCQGSTHLTREFGNLEHCCDQHSVRGASHASS
jgi:hypothetical protein